MCAYPCICHRQSYRHKGHSFLLLWNVYRACMTVWCAYLSYIVIKCVEFSLSWTGSQSQVCKRSTSYVYISKCTLFNYQSVVKPRVNTSLRIMGSQDRWGHWRSKRTMQKAESNKTPRSRIATHGPGWWFRPCWPSQSYWRRSPVAHGRRSRKSFRTWGRFAGVFVDFSRQKHTWHDGWLNWGLL